MGKEEQFENIVFFFLGNSENIDMYFLLGFGFGICVVFMALPAIICCNRGNTTGK